jgi:hypothetical protein
VKIVAWVEPPAVTVGSFTMAKQRARVWARDMSLGMACEKIIDCLSADIESGLFDFDDAGHARAFATGAAERR